MKNLLFSVIAIFVALSINSSSANDGAHDITITAMYADNLHWKNEKHTEYDFTLVIEYEPDPNTSVLSPGCHSWCHPSGQSWIDLGYCSPATKTQLGAHGWRITFECDATAYISTEWKAQIVITGYQSSNIEIITTNWPD
ncbi:MAG TPA: hypothetical protein PKI62_14445 [bacterium]|nr:hypothetical protein [bacterium]HPR88949.1 hypothetical protein [bacterium]